MLVHSQCNAAPVGSRSANDYVDAESAYRHLPVDVALNRRYYCHFPTLPLLGFTVLASCRWCGLDPSVGPRCGDQDEGRAVTVTVAAGGKMPWNRVSMLQRGDWKAGGQSPESRLGIKI